METERTPEKEDGGQFSLERPVINYSRAAAFIILEKLSLFLKSPPPTHAFKQLSISIAPVFPLVVKIGWVCSSEEIEYDLRIESIARDDACFGNGSSSALDGVWRLERGVLVFILCLYTEMYFNMGGNVLVSK